MTRLETICKEPERKDRQENGEVKFLSLSFRYFKTGYTVHGQDFTKKVNPHSNQMTLVLA